MDVSLTDRRRETRMDLRVPLKIRALAEPSSGEHAADCINFSQRGLCLATAYPLTVGAIIEVFMRVPHESTGRAASEVRCTARVVHVRLGRLSGRMEVGLRIERSDAAAVRERWVS